MKKRILFIINPHSGHQRGLDLIRWIPKYLDKDQFEYTHILTQYAKHATQIAAQAVKDKIDIVAAVGGDGLVNEVFQSLIHTDTAFTIIPMGSGNGVARSIGINMNIKKALIDLNNGKYSRMDTVVFNEQPYLGVAGIGFDGLIAWEFSKTKKRGVFSYIKLIFKQLFAFKSSYYHVTTDTGETREFDAYAVSIANTPQYGNNAYIAPLATIDSGELHLVVVRRHSKWLLPILAYYVMTKKVHQYKYAVTISSPCFQINTDFKQSHIDGEPITSEKSNRVSILPMSINIYA